MNNSFTTTNCRYVLFSMIGLTFCLPTYAHDDCTTCHRQQTPTEQQAMLIQDLPKLCINCHADRAGNGEHIIEVFPQGTTDPLPLVEGKLGCITCHDPHGTQPGQLRVSAADLCMICHQY